MIDGDRAKGRETSRRYGSTCILIKDSSKEVDLPMVSNEEWTSATENANGETCHSFVTMNVGDDERIIHLKVSTVESELF